MKNSDQTSLLIVDDEKSITFAICSFLEDIGYKCHGARSAEEALDILKTESFDIVISDIKMPGIDGIEFMKKAKKINNDMNFIIITGNIYQYSYTEIIHSGASDYIRKPVEFNELEAKINRILRENALNNILQTKNNRLKKVLKNAAQMKKKAELAYSEMYQIFNSAGDGMMIIDFNYNILKVNNAFFSIYKSDQKEIIGKKCYEIFSSQHCQKDSCSVKNIKNGKSQIEKDYEVVDIENRIQTFLVTSTPFKDNNGETTAVIKKIKNITWMKEAEQERNILMEREKEIEIIAKTAEIEKKNSEKLQLLNKQLTDSLNELEIKQNALTKSKRELSIRNKIMHDFSVIDDDEIYRKVLIHILEEFKSSIGIVGYIDDDGCLVCPSFTIDYIWEKCNITNKSFSFPPDVLSILKSFRIPIIEKKTFCCNEKINVPEGHIPIYRLISTPIISNKNVIGIVCVGNKEDDYSIEEKYLLESVAKSISPVLDARLKRNRLEIKRKKAEEELHKNKIYLENILKSIVDALIVTDLNGTIITVNKGALLMTGYNEKELIGSNFGIIIDNNNDNMDENQIPQVLQKLIKYGTIEDYNISYKTKELDNISVSFSGSLMFDNNNNKKALVTIARDITELKEITAQLIQAEKMVALGELTAGVAHELSQPMNVIKIICQSTLMDIKKDRFIQEDLQSDLQDIVGQIDRMSAITSHMRVFTRRSTDLPMEVLNINDVLESVFSFFTQQLTVHNIDVIKEYEDQLPVILGDPIRIEQVIMNLITNARKAVEKNEREEKFIQIKTYSIEENDSLLKKKSVGITVTDNGLGVPEKFENKIFDQFFTTREPGEGTGLGLSISRKIIEEHKGLIYLKNNKGHGASFCIVLPVHYYDKENI